MLDHPLLDRIDAALTGLLPEVTVGLRGEWSARSRRTYPTAAQEDPGSGPFDDVIDHVWHGRVESADAVTGMAFLRTGTDVCWVKAADASPTLAVNLSLHAWAEHLADRMTFAAGLGNAVLPGMSVRASPALPRGCLVAPGAIPVGRLARIARTDEVDFLVALFPGQAVKFGRKRLWRLRDELASQLPEDVRELMSRGRTGSWRLKPGRGA